MIKINNELRDRCHKIGCDLGWHKEEHSSEYDVMLIIAELSDAVKASLDNKYASRVNGSKNDLGNSFLIRYNILIEQTVEYKLANVIIRCLDLAALKSIDVSSLNGEIIPYSVLNDDVKVTNFAEFAFHLIATFYEHDYSIEEYLLSFIMCILSYLKEYNLDILPYLDRNIQHELDKISYQKNENEKALYFLNNA